jgi:hypothetical protein
MWFCVLFLLQLLTLTAGLTKDQIFQEDWQTVHTGLPFDSLVSNDRLITLSSIGIISVIDLKDGSTLHRYQTEFLLINATSKLVRISDELILTYLNFEKGIDVTPYLNSKIIVFNTSKTNLEFVTELAFESTILTALPVDNLIYVVDQYSIFTIDINSNRKSIIYASEDCITHAKLFYNSNINQLYVVFEIDGKVLYSKLSEFKLKQLNECKTSGLRFVESQDNIFICGDKKAYKIDNHGIEKLPSNANMITDKLSANFFINDDIDAFTIIGDYVLINSNDNIKSFNYKETDSSITTQFELPNSFVDSIYHSFYISENATQVNLLTVSPSNAICYYSNGILKWHNDQSFTDIVDTVIISSEVSSPLTLEEFMFETSSNIFTSYIRRVIHNYNTLFNDSNIPRSEIDRFGMNKYLIALSANGKIGVYKMFKMEGNQQHLVMIFELPIKLEKLYEIDNKVYGLSMNVIYHVDIETRKLNKMPDQFINENFKLLTHDSQIDFIKTSANDFYTTSFSEEDNKIQGHLIDNETQLDTWIFKPHREKIISLSKRSYDNNNVAQNALVLPNRSVLYKYLIPNIGVITTAKKFENTLNFYIINLITGQIYGQFTKSVSENLDLKLDFNIEFEENFIIFSIPSKTNTLDTELCIIDLFESLKPNEKVSKNINSYSAFENTILPAFASQCYIIPGNKVRNILISKTKHNIAAKDIILANDYGQIMSVPKVIIDGRRNGVIGDFKVKGIDFISLNNINVPSNPLKITASQYGSLIANTFKYDPIINIHPRFIMTHYRKLITNATKKLMIFTIPTDLESTSYVVSIDTDIFVTIIRPSGSFDRLTSSFNTKVLISTLAVLLFAIIYIRPKTEKGKILSLWSL